MRLKPEERVVVRAAASVNRWQQNCWYPADQCYVIRVPADTRYPGIERFAVEASCPSMDLRYPQRSLLICVPFGATEGGIEIGKRYLIETRRERCGVQESELAVRKLIMNEDNSMRFVSESSDPDYQQSVPVLGAGDDEIQPIALVIGSIKPE